MTARQALSLLRKAARDSDRSLKVVRVVNPNTGKPRGNGSHEVWALQDSEGKEVARGGLTKHPGDMSTKVTCNFEAAFEGEFGEGWMER